MTGTPSGRQLHMDDGTTRYSGEVGAFLHAPNRDAARVCGEAAYSKALVRGTRSAYEAAEDGRGRVEVRSPKVIRNPRLYMRRMYGAKVTRLTPGGLFVCLELEARRGFWSSRKRGPGLSRGTPRQRSEQRATRDSAPNKGSRKVNEGQTGDSRIHKLSAHGNEGGTQGNEPERSIR
jgi:hypothetical protein